MSDKNDEQNIDFALILVRQKLEFQSKVTQSLDTKTGILIGFVSVIAANLIIVIKADHSLMGLNLFSLGLIVLGFALLNLIMATLTKEYLDPPDFDTFYSEDALAKPNIDLKNQVIADMKKSYNQNYLNDTNRGRYFDRSVWAVAGSILLLVIGVI
jgi:hypothetical protein